MSGERRSGKDGQPIWQMAQMRAALSEEGGRRAGGEQVQSSRRPYLLTTTAHICKMQSGSIKSPFNRLFAELLTERDPFFRRPTTINLDSFFAVHSCLLSPSNSLIHPEARGKGGKGGMRADNVLRRNSSKGRKFFFPLRNNGGRRRLINAVRHVCDSAHFSQ